MYKALDSIIRFYFTFDNKPPVNCVLYASGATCEIEEELMYVISQCVVLKNQLNFM